MPLRPTLLLAATIALAGCDQLGIETPAREAERALAEGKAIGAACRHAGRAIEDCYVLNKKADKAAMFAGWREMNDYMRENSIEVVEPKVPPEPPPKPVAAADAEDEEAEAEPPASGKHSRSGG